LIGHPRVEPHFLPSKVVKLTNYVSKTHVLGAYTIAPSYLQ
jgi:hypothetical protein